MIFYGFTMYLLRMCYGCTKDVLRICYVFIIDLLRIWYEFTKDLNYLEHKSKLTARPANYDLMTYAPFQPIYYTNNWQGVLDDSLSTQTLKVLLERYRG